LAFALISPSLPSQTETGERLLKVATAEVCESFKALAGQKHAMREIVIYIQITILLVLLASAI